MARTPEQGCDTAPGTFAALAVPAYRMLWLSGSLAFMTVQLQIIARGWLARQLTGTNTGLGAVYLSFGVPALLAGPWAGLAADRFPKRHILLCGQLVMLLSSAGVGVAVVLDVIDYWMLLAASVLQGLAFAFFAPARMAFTGQLVGRDLLPNAIALGQISLNGSRVLGPALAGLLIGSAAIGVGGTYLIAAAIVVCGALLLMTSVPRGDPRGQDSRRSPLADMVDVLGYVRRRRDLLLLVTTSVVVMMAAFPYIAFLPTMADETFHAGSAGYGVMSAVSAVGGLAASLYVAGRAGSAHRWRLQNVAGLGFGAGVLLLAVAPTFTFAVAAILVAGAAAAGFQSMNNTLVLSLSDLEYHGRLQSLLMLSISGFSVTALPLGLVADAVGLRQTLVGMALVALVAMALSLLARRRARRRPDVPPI